MTELEKAYQEVKEQCDYIRKTASAKPHSKSAAVVKSFDIALDALHERMEREDGCEYCNLTEPPKDWDVSMKSFVVGDREYIPCDDYFYSFTRRISHCPMCGRKLTQPKED